MGGPFSMKAASRVIVFPIVTLQSANYSVCNSLGGSKVLSRKEYDAEVLKITQTGIQIERRVRFIMMFSPELSSESIFRNLARLEELGQQLTAQSKQLRSLLTVKTD